MVFELKWLFFLDLSMVDRRLHDDLRKIYLHLKAPRFDLHRLASDRFTTNLSQLEFKFRWPIVYE
jgi:hypothetical protein